MGLFGKSKEKQIQECWQLAQNCIQKGDNRNAIAYLNKALEINVNVELSWAKLGDLYYKLGEYDNCLHCSNQVVKLSFE